MAIQNSNKKTSGSVAKGGSVLGDTATNQLFLAAEKWVDAYTRALQSPDGGRNFTLSITHPMRQALKGAKHRNLVRLAKVPKGGKLTPTLGNKAMVLKAKELMDFEDKMPGIPLGLTVVMGRGGAGKTVQLRELRDGNAPSKPIIGMGEPGAYTDYDLLVFLDMCRRLRQGDVLFLDSLRDFWDDPYFLNTRAGATSSGIAPPIRGFLALVNNALLWDGKRAVVVMNPLNTKSSSGNQEGGPVSEMVNSLVSGFREAVRRDGDSFALSYNAGKFIDRGLMDKVNLIEGIPMSRGELGRGSSAQAKDLSSPFNHSSLF